MGFESAYGTGSLRGTSDGHSRVALQLERDPAVPVRCPTEGPRSVGRLEPHDRHDNAEPLERAIRALRANWDTMGSWCWASGACGRRLVRASRTPVPKLSLIHISEPTRLGMI